MRVHPAATTGRHVVTFADDVDAMAVLHGCGLADVACSRDFEDQAVDAGTVTAAEAAVFTELGIAVVAVADPRLDTLRTAAAEHRQVLAVSPELVHHALTTPPSPPPATPPAMADPPVDDDRATWGLRAVGALASPRTGRGVTVAVLDTGLALDHPHFAGRAVTARSFVEGSAAQDVHGHGTHCAGTVCGPRDGAGRAHGVAPEATLLAGKVLGDDGAGSDATILAGLNWAVAGGAAVVSMSLGADVREAHPPYTTAGRRALRAGTLVVAAAGNNARRPDDPGFVGAPANSPTVLAVAAVDHELAVADFSARTLPGHGGQVDIAGPGVDVYSCWIDPDQHRTISGTSMATPHVAGVAALLAQDGGPRGAALWADLVARARRLPARSDDVGSGLVQAPAG
jgi:subtilisin family serine protease